MADENTINGVASDADDRTVEIDGISKTDREDLDVDRSEMIRKIKALEHEKVELVRENDEIRERIGNLTVELEGLRSDKVEMRGRLGEMEREIEQSKSDKKAVEAIAARAVELETQVSRLQHDLISSMSEGQEANAEVAKLKNVLEEKIMKLENLEKEKAGLSKEMEEAKAELESMAVRVRNESSERIRVEEEAEVRIGEKESEIRGLNKRIDELESALVKNALELEKLVKEKKDEVGAKNDAVKAAKTENEKAGVTESQLSKVMEELEESKRVIKELKEKAVGGVNGVATVAREGILGGEEKGLKLQWPAVIASTGTIAAMAVVFYLRCAKQR